MCQTVSTTEEMREILSNNQIRIKTTQKHELSYFLAQHIMFDRMMHSSLDYQQGLHSIISSYIRDQIFTSYNYYSDGPHCPQLKKRSKWNCHTDTTFIAYNHLIMKFYSNEFKTSLIRNIDTLLFLFGILHIFLFKILIRNQGTKEKHTGPKQCFKWEQKITENDSNGNGL